MTYDLKILVEVLIFWVNQLVKHVPDEPTNRILISKPLFTLCLNLMFLIYILIEKVFSKFDYWVNVTCSRKNSINTEREKKLLLKNEKKNESIGLEIWQTLHRLQNAHKTNPLRSCSNVELQMILDKIKTKYEKNQLRHIDFDK